MYTLGQSEFFRLFMMLALSSFSAVLSHTALRGDNPVWQSLKAVVGFSYQLSFGHAARRFGLRYPAQVNRASVRSRVPNTRSNHSTARGKPEYVFRARVAQIIASILL